MIGAQIVVNIYVQIKRDERTFTITLNYFDDSFFFLSIEGTMRVYTIKLYEKKNKV
jgi:hypothetical protein